MNPRILFSAPWVLPISSSPIRSGAVAVRGDQIQAVGKSQFLQKKFSAYRVIHLPQAILMPGFVNAHSHVTHSHLKGCLPRGNFARWLKAMVSQVKDFNRTESQCQASCQAGILEGIRSGVTTFADSGPTLDPVPIFVKTGVRAIFYLEIFSFLQTGDRAFSHTLQKILDLRRKLPSRIQVGLSPHSPYTARPEFLRYLASNAALKKIPLSLHVAESLEETRFFRSGDGAISLIFPQRSLHIPRAPSPVCYLENVGLLKRRLLAAHCVHVNPEDLNLLQRRKTSIAVCPLSNAWLKVGTPPLRTFFKLGLPVGLGTDSAASAPTLNFFETLRAAAQLGLTPREAVEISTIGGARALGWHAQIGCLEPGKKADLIGLFAGKDILDSKKDPYALILKKGSSHNLLFSLVDGCFVWKKRNVIKPIPSI